MRRPPNSFGMSTLRCVNPISHLTDRIRCRFQDRLRRRRGSLELDGSGDDLSDPEQHLFLFFADLSRASIEDAERTYDGSVVGFEGHTSVEADAKLAKEWLVGREGIFGRVGDDEDGFGGDQPGQNRRIMHGVGEGEGIVGQPTLRLPEASFVVSCGDERDRCIEGSREVGCEAMECTFFGFVNDVDTLHFEEGLG